MLDDDKVMVMIVRVRWRCCQHSSDRDIETGAREEEIEMPEMRKISRTQLVTKLLSRAFLIKPPAAAAENLNDNFFRKLFSSRKYGCERTVKWKMLPIVMMLLCQTTRIMLTFVD